MANDYNHYANESPHEKDKRVDGYGMQKLYDKFHQTNEPRTNISASANKKSNYFYNHTRKTYSSEISKSKIGYKSSYTINNQSLNYATDMHLTPIRIKCNPKLTDRQSSLAFVKELFEKIKISFKNKYSNQDDQIGCDLWWVNKEGELVLITKNLDLYIYLCDVRHYPEEINDTRLSPVLPVRLPPQHALVIKFVPNDYSFFDLEEELKKRYASTYNVEEMKGTMRLHSRHIRLDVYNKDEHRKISNSGTITLGGLLCEVDEYLPAPKILICTRCNCPGHSKNTCRLDYERCRRCGEDRKNNNHDQCPITCHHCGGDHQANNYKCPTMIQFRRNLIEQLKENPNRLPPHIQMFIPFDCRNERTEKVISNTKDNLQQQSNHEMPCLTNKQDWPYLSHTTHNTNLNQHIITLQNELDSFKSTYKQEVEKINNHFQKQNNYLHIACSIMKRLTFDVNQNLMNMINKCFELMEERTTSQQAKQKIGVFREDLKNYQKYATERQTTYNNYVKTLETLWTKQTDNIDELLEKQITNLENEQFEGTEKEKIILAEILKEWNERKGISDVCRKWNKERPTEKIENILIMLYNCECLSTHTQDIDIILNQYTPQIIILTGVGSMINKLPYTPNYYWHSQKGTNSFGGVAILIHSSLKSKIIEKTENFLTIELELGQEEILLGAVYVPPNNKIPTKRFEIFRDKKFFLFGDFNAKHTTWDCKINNSSGIEMKEWLEQNGYEGIIPTTPTSKRSDAIIDFGVGYSSVGWSNEVVDLGTSDHFPILYSSPYTIEKQIIFKKTNWEIFNFFLSCVFQYWNSCVYNFEAQDFFVLFSKFLKALWDRTSKYETVLKYRPP